MSGAGRAARFVAPARGRPAAEINVTPLVDVVLVLLITFMVLTPLSEEVLRLRVPDAEETAEHARPERTQLVVGIDASGGLALNGSALDDGAYGERLSRALGALPPGERIVFFAAADEAPYQRLVLALDGARRAGAEVLTFATEPVAPAAAPPPR